jgi:hypothetical protein
MSPASPARRIAKSLAPIFAIVLLWLLFFWRVITPAPADRLTFQQGDFTLQFLAYRQLAFDQFAHGRFPVIEECIYSGHPFQADPQSQVLYPPVLLFMLIGRALGWSEYPLRALEWEVMLHVLLAALGMYAFLRSSPHPTLPRARGSTKVGAVFGALAFAFGGFMTGYATLQTAILQTAAWLPLILLALKWLATARRWLPAAALLAALVFFAFTAGHPQTLLFIVYAGALAFVWWSLTRPDGFQKPVRSIVIRALVAGAFAIGLSAAQLLPTLSFMLASTRASLAFEQAGRGFALHDISLFALAGVTNVWQPLFAGISALAFAGVALFAASRARLGARNSRQGARTQQVDDTWLWVVIGLGALVLSFGANAFGFDLAYLLAPGYRQFQSQERHAVVIALCVGVLSAYGVNALLRPLRRRARLQLRKAAKSLALWALVAFAAMIAALIAGRALPEANMGDAADKLALLALGLLGTAGLFAWRARLSNLAVFEATASTPTPAPSLKGRGVGRPRTLWGIAALALLVFELFSANRMTALQPPADPFPPNALISPIQQDTTYATQFTRVYNHFGLPLNGACVRGLNEVAGGSPIVMRDYKTFLARAPEDVMIKLLNVRHAVTWRGAMTTPEGKEMPWFLLARDSFEGKPASTFRLDWEPKGFNGAWIASDVRNEQGDAMFDAMRREGFDPFSTAFVSAPTPSPSPYAGGGEKGSAAIEGKAAGYIKVAANVSAPALLVLSEAYHWNWTARVNGNDAQPVPVNGALLGVPIPAGAASVELSYRPSELIAGAALSAITLLVMLAALFAGARRRNVP